MQKGIFSLYLPGFRPITLTALGLVMRLFRRLFHLHVHLTLLNLYLFLSRRIQKHARESLLLAVCTITSIELSSSGLKLPAPMGACAKRSDWGAHSQPAPGISGGPQEGVCFPSLGSDTFHFSLPHPINFMGSFKCKVSHNTVVATIPSPVGV